MEWSRGAWLLQKDYLQIHPPGMKWHFCFYGSPGTMEAQDAREWMAGTMLSVPTSAMEDAQMCCVCV